MVPPPLSLLSGVSIVFVIKYRLPNSKTVRPNGSVVETMGHLRFEVVDSLKEFQAFCQNSQTRKLIEAWHIMANFGADDVTKEVFEECIYPAKVGVKIVVPGTEFEEQSGVPMEFTILNASIFV